MENENNNSNNSIDINNYIAEILDSKYVKIIYEGTDAKYHEIATKIQSVDKQMISLYCKLDDNLKIKHPQEIIIKFVFDDYLYLTKSTLKDTQIQDNLIYFYIALPPKLLKQQNRRFYRADLDCLCVLVITDKSNKTKAYLARSVNISANGILIHKVETTYSDGYVNFEMSKDDYYNIVIFLDSKTVLKQFAKFVRQERKNNICRYAFQLIAQNSESTDAISEYVAKEQMKQM